MIDNARISEYNKRLKEVKEKSSKLRSDIEYSERELKSICDELTNTLGYEVNMSNIQEVCEKVSAEIERTLEAGEEILNRITGEQADSAKMAPAPTPTTGVGMGVGTSGVASGMPGATMGNPVVAPQTRTAPLGQSPAQGSFGQGQATQPARPQGIFNSVPASTGAPMNLGVGIGVGMGETDEPEVRIGTEESEGMNSFFKNLGI